VKSGSLRDFLKKLPTMGVPEKFTIKHLESLGFKSPNDRPIISILKHIEFLDAEGKPTENYRAFRNTAKGKGVMAACLTKTYGDLFVTYPDANIRDKEALRNFFSAGVESGEKVLAATVDTFKTLCEFANFESPAPVEKSSTGGMASTVTRTPLETGGLVVNLNVQIQLPLAEDIGIYDKIFASLKKNLLER
jgi:hypothetical protein